MKKFLAILLAICMVFAMSSVAMAADKVAQIEDTKYATLEEAIEAVGDGDVVIELLADATLDYGAREAYGTEGTKSVTINGNGNTLTLNQTNSDWSSLGLKNAEAKLVLNNMTIVKTGEGATSGAWNKHTINIHCNVEMNEVTVQNSVAVKKNATLNDVTINEAGDYYALWISGEGQTVTVTDSSIIATQGRGIKIADQYVDNAKSVILNVTDTVFNTKKKAAVLVSSKAGAEITAENVDIRKVKADKENFVQVDEDWAQYNSKVIVEGGGKAQEGMDSMVASIVKDDVVQGYYSDLEDAFNAAKDGDTITLLKDFDKDVIVSQKENVKITIDGADKTFSGTITVDGKSKRYETAAVTIKNVNFDATGITKDACINLGAKGDNNTRYTNNVTVENCTFTGKDQEKVAVKSYTGGDWNLVVRGCSVDNTMHSLLQVTNVEKGLVIDGCTVKSKNGINLNSSAGVEIKNSTIEVSGYAVRIGAGSGGASGEVTLTGNTLKTDNTEGDPVIELRGAAPEQVELSMSENVVSGDTHISGVEADTKIAADANYWDGQNGPTVSGADLDVNSYYKDEALSDLHVIEPFNYVSIGASNVNGYGMHGYLDEEVYEYPLLKETANIYGYKQDTPGSYPVLIKDYFADQLGVDYDVNLSQLALSSMRAEEVRFLLDDTYKGDKYTDWRFIDIPGYDDRDSQNWFYLAGKLEWEAQGNSGTPTQEQAVDALKAAYRDAITNADVITVDIGINNFGVYASNQIVSNMYENDLSKIDPELAAKYEEAKDYVKEVIAEYVNETVLSTEVMEHMVDTMAYALVGFCTSFDATMEQIYTLNPDAEVVVVSIQNLMYGLNAQIPGVEQSIPFGDMFGAVVNAANIYTASVSPYADQYKYADVRQKGHVEFFMDEILTYNGDPATLSQDMKDCFDVYDGDLYIKARIQQILAKELYSKGLLDISAVPAGYNIVGNLEHFALAYQHDLLTIPVLNMNLDDFFAAGEAGQLPANAQPYYDSYVVALNTAHDVAAEIMQAGIEVDTLDATSFGQKFGPVEDEIFGEIFDVLEKAVMASIADPSYEFSLSDGFFESVAEEYDRTPEFVKTVATMGIRTGIGNSFFGHPNGNGQVELKKAIVNAYENNITGKDVVTEEAINAWEDITNFFDENGEELLAKLYAYAEAEGYIDQLETAVAELLENAKAAVEAEIEKLEAELEALKEQYGVDEKIAAIEARIAELETALERIEDDCNRIMDSVAQIESDLNALDSIIKGETEATLKDVEALVADIIKEVKNIEAAATDLLDTVDTYIADLEAAGQAVAEALNAAADALGTATDALADLISEYGDDLAQAIYEFAEKVGAIDMMEDALADMEAKAVAQLEAVIAELEAQLAELEKLVQSPEVQAQIEAVKAEIAKAEAALAELQKAIDEAKAYIENLETYVNEMIDAITEGAEAELEKLEAAIAAELEKLDAAVAVALEELKAAAENAANEALAELEALAAELEAQWNALVAEIEKAYANATFAVAGCGNHNYLALGGATTAGILVDNKAVSYVNDVADYFGDVDFKNKANANLTVDGLVDYVKANAADIEAANVITYNMDATHFVNATLNGLAGDAVAWDKYLSAEEIETVNKVKAAVLKELAKEIDAATLELLAPVVENLAFSAVSYGVETVNAVETIQAINEDALLIVTGMYNPFVGLNAKVGGEVFDLGEAFEYVIEATNAYYLGYAMIDGNTLFVDISDAEITGFDGFTIDLENPLGTAVLMRAWNNMFANAKGHAYIVEQICNAVELTGHAEEIIPAVAATCTETGLTEGKKCSVCGEILVAQEVVAALGHTEEIIPAVAATCTETGLTEGKKCSVCGETLVAQEVVGVIPHTEEIIPAVPATCTETGLTEGKKCSVCGEILVAQEVVAKLAHNFVINENGEYVCGDCGISKEEWESFPFDDIGHGTDSPHWAYNYIRYVYENGIMNGIGDRKFDPEGKATRAMIVTMLYRLETGELNKAYDGENIFTDLENDEWYTNAMLWATDHEILKGFGDGTCRPNDIVTREQFASFMYRYADLKGLDLVGDHDLTLAFPGDGHTVSDWAVPAMSWATGVGLFEGHDNGLLDPQGDATRAQVAKVFYCFIEKVL